MLGINESIQDGFKIIRDTFVFTDKRFIIIDVQGMTGKKIEYQSIPYSKITFYSIETSGHFDLDAELKIWIGSIATPIEKKFNKKVNLLPCPQKPFHRFRQRHWLHTVHPWHARYW